MRLVYFPVYIGVASLICSKPIRKEPTSSVEAVGKKKIGKKVQKCLWKSPYFSNGQPDLFKPDGGVA